MEKKHDAALESMLAMQRSAAGFRTVTLLKQRDLLIERLCVAIELEADIVSTKDEEHATILRRLAEAAREVIGVGVPS